MISGFNLALVTVTWYLFSYEAFHMLDVGFFLILFTIHIIYLPLQILLLISLYMVLSGNGTASKVSTAVKY